MANDYDSTIPSTLMPARLEPKAQRPSSSRFILILAVAVVILVLVILRLGD